MERFISDFKSSSADEKCVLLLTISLFLPLAATVAAVGAAIIFILFFRKPCELFKRAKGSAFLIALSLLAVLTPLTLGRYMSAVCGLVVPAASIILVYLRSVMNDGLLKRCLNIACVMSVVCFAVALVEFIVMNDPEYRVVSCFRNANYYAMMIELVIVICTYKLCAETGSRLHYICVFVLNLIGLYLTDCRTPWFIIAAVIPITTLLLKKYKTFAMQCVVIAVLLAIVLLNPNIIPRMNLLEQSVGVRSEIWSASLKLFLENPVFGWGINAYAELGDIVGAYGAKHTHSLYLELLVDFGLLGTALLGAYMVNAFISAIKNRAGKYFPIAVGMTLVVLLHGVVDVTVFWPSTGLLYALIMTHQSAS